MNDRVGAAYSGSTWRGAGGRTLPVFLLVLLILAVYSPLTSHDFVIYGDDLWVTKNDWVQTGLNVDSVGWAFTSVEGERWIPLARISVLADAEIFGMKAGGTTLRASSSTPLPPFCSFCPSPG